MKRLLVAAFVMSAALSGYAQEDPDAKKTGSALLGEGHRLETEKPVDLNKAIAKYKKAVDKGPKEVSAQALVRIGYCNEKLEPENVEEALNNYKRVAAEFADVEVWGTRAQEKVALNGVDVFLKRLAAQLRPWRDNRAISPQDENLLKIQQATWEKIQAKDKAAVDGLIWGLTQDDEVVREFSAEKLAEVIDAEGIPKLIAALNHDKPAARAGVSTALQKIYKKFNDGAELDRQASNLTRDSDVSSGSATPRALDSIAKIKPVIEALKKKAAEIRHNIPESLNTPEIQGALEKIIGDENAHPLARMEGAKAAAWIGPVSGGLTEAILKGMQARNRNVRQASCRAAGAVDTSKSDDKHKLVDHLIKVIKYEPSRPAGDENKPPSGNDSDHPDWQNDEVVRQAAAEALEQVALVKSLPALIEALGDNDARVRHSAHRALREITGKDFGYEPDKPLKERQEKQEEWKKWWTDTEGIVVLVERFWYFQSQWKEFTAAKLFDKAFFLKEVESRMWASVDPKADMERANRVVENFQRLKDVFVQDAVDIGPGAVDKLLKFIGGETELEDRERKTPKPNSPTRSFVAESCARIVAQHNVTDAVEKIRNAVTSGDSAAKKAGGALSLGFLPRDKTGGSERQALVQGLGDGDALVREACAIALAKIGEEGNADDLKKTAQDSDEKVQIASLRAISQIKPKNEDVVKVLGEMVADEPDPTLGVPSKKSAIPFVRENAVDALGNIGLPSAIPHLLRSRRDTMRNVREAAQAAVRKVYEGNKDATREEALKVFRDEKRKVDDRRGAALSLGDMNDPAIAKSLALRLRDENPPRLLRDQDPEVRIHICQALGALKAKTATVVGNLLSAMADEDEREPVRNEAYKALKAVSEQDLENGKFNASDPKDKRDGAIRAWQEWFRNAGLKDEA